MAAEQTVRRFVDKKLPSGPFAPLSGTSSLGAATAPPRIKGIVFDMDGTLTVPQNWMFGEMRAVLGIDQSVDILGHLAALEDPERSLAEAAVKSIEDKAMIGMKARDGLVELFEYMEREGIKKTICTRNYAQPVDFLVEKFMPNIKLTPPVMTRDFVPTKPAPDALWQIAREWGHGPDELMMVGDTMDDIKAGHGAGFTTVLITSEANAHIQSFAEVDYVVDSHYEIQEFLKSQK